MKINYSATAAFKGLLRDNILGVQRSGELLGAGRRPHTTATHPLSPAIALGQG